MNALYLFAPDFPNGSGKTAPEDGSAVRKVLAQTNDTLEELIARVVAAAKGFPINLMRICAHGNSGVISVFGLKRGEKGDGINMGRPGCFEALQKLRPCFDRGYGCRREIYVHACYVASDTFIACDVSAGTCPAQGVAKAGRGTAAAVGFTCLQGLANAAQVPVVGTVDLIHYQGAFDWTFPGRTLYVYPSTSDPVVTTFDSYPTKAPMVPD